MMTKVLLIVSIAAPLLMVIIISASAGTLYEYFKNTRNEYPMLFKIIGFNEKYMNDKNAWIYRFKAYVILMAIFIALIGIAIAFGI